MCDHDKTQDGVWPDHRGDDTLCYECFETEADRSWWEALPLVLAMVEHKEE